jgi:hypothetical protein
MIGPYPRTAEQAATVETGRGKGRVFGWNRSKIGPVFDFSAASGQKATETSPELYQNFTEFDQISIFSPLVTSGEPRHRGANVAPGTPRPATQCTKENQREPKRTKSYRKLNFAGRWLPGEAETVQESSRAARTGAGSRTSDVSLFAFRCRRQEEVRSPNHEAAVSARRPHPRVRVRLSTQGNSGIVGGHKGSQTV